MWEMDDKSDLRGDLCVLDWYGHADNITHAFVGTGNAIKVGLGFTVFSLPFWGQTKYSLNQHYKRCLENNRGGLFPLMPAAQCQACSMNTGLPFPFLASMDNVIG